MNNKTRIGRALICVGMGFYLLALEAVRLINFYAAKFYQLASQIYGLSCIFPAALITAGLILLMVYRIGVISLSIFGIICFCFLCVALFYFAYVIPFLRNDSPQEIDWLLVSATCFAGILLLGWGCFDLVKQKQS